MGAAVNVARGALVTFATWQAAVWLLSPPRYILPSPIEVGVAFGRSFGTLMQHLAITVAEILLGLALGTAAGVSVALLVVAVPRFGRLVWPVVVVLQALPVFAIAPLLVLWFGFGMGSKVVMTMLIIFFPIASSLADGLRRTDPDILDATALTAATHWQTIWLVRLPLALPHLLSGLRVAAALAPLGAVVGEWVGASGGLGFLLLQANARMQTDVMFAALALLAGLTLLLRFSVDELARPLIPWVTEADTHMQLRQR